MNNKPLTIQLTLAETNLILQALGELPYKDVYHLIGSIHRQASQHLVGEEESRSPADDDFATRNAGDSAIKLRPSGT